jgi:hypothetical protein
MHLPSAFQRLSQVATPKPWIRLRHARAQVLLIAAALYLLVFNVSAHSRDTLAITSPLPNERFVTNATVNLKVSLGDRHIDASEVVWTSSVSGELGRGPTIQVSKLPPGTHNITVSIHGETQSVSIREFKDLWELYQATPSQAEIDRTNKDFTFNWIDGGERDEKWATYDPPTFNQASLTPSKVVVLMRLEVLRRQVFSEPLPFGDGLPVYDHLRKHVKRLSLMLDCNDNSGGGGNITLHRWQNTWDLTRRDCKSPAPTDPHLNGYVGPLFLLMHESRHNQPGDPGHTTCYGFGNMDPALDKGSGHAWATLYAMWVYKYGLYDPPLMKQSARINAYALLSRFCSKPTSSNPKVQAIIDELLAEPSAKTLAGLSSSPLPAPELLFPADGAALKDPELRTNLRWNPVPAAAVYVVEWDYKSGNTWTAELPPRVPEQAKGWWAESRRPFLSEFPTTATDYSFQFVGAQPGRWRVWAVDAEGHPGTKSEWREFRHSR